MESWLDALLEKFDRDNQILNVTKIEIENDSEKGGNYASQVSRAKINALLGTGDKIVRRVILKQQLGEKGQELFKEFHLFKRETMMYQFVFKQMESLMNEFEDSDKMWCNMLGFKPYSIIALQDLSTKGFKVAERRNCLDLNHSLLVIRSLAKFHALSKILIERGIITRNDFGPFWCLMDTQFVKDEFQVSMRQLSNVMKKSWPSKWKPIAMKIEAQVAQVANKLNLLANEKSDFEVINHGDPWTTNIMFKYSPFKNEPIGLRFIDFQVCHYNSYIFDLVYFVYSSVVPDIRRKYLDKLLSSYQEALQYYLKLYSYQGKIPSLDDVKSEHKRVLYLSFLILVWLHPAMTADVALPMDIEKLLPQAGKEKSDFCDPEIWKTQKYINNIGPDFEYYVANNII